MNIKVLSQYAGDSAHFSEINSLLTDESFNLFRVMVAYVTLGGLKIIEDKLFEYLERGNKLDWIIGIEQGITSKDALEYLLHLRDKYPSNVRIRIFTSGNNSNIFHTKIYWLIGEKAHSIIIGSSNLTLGGLRDNFEASILFNLNVSKDEDKAEVQQFERVWQTFSKPSPPLSKDNLIELNKDVLALIKPDDVSKRSACNEIIGHIPHPFSKVNRRKEIAENIRKLHSDTFKKLYFARTGRKNRTISRATRIVIASQPTHLIMDILQETRETQVQIPTDVLRPYFNIRSLSRGRTILLSEVSGGEIVRQDERPFIMQRNSTYRLEIYGIKRSPRPCIIRFTKKDDRHYEYEIILRSSPEYEALNQLLKERGQQTRAGSRRYIIVD